MLLVWFVPENESRDIVTGEAESRPCLSDDTFVHISTRDVA
jgi:hypothetical protein